MWTQGTIGVKDSNGRMVSVSYWIKHYEEPSEEYGISGGRISKLMLKQDGRVVYNYDRGEDIKPQTPEAEASKDTRIAEATDLHVNQLVLSSTVCRSLFKAWIQYSRRCI